MALFVLVGGSARRKLREKVALKGDSIMRERERETGAEGRVKTHFNGGQREKLLVGEVRESCLGRGSGGIGRPDG